MVLAIPKILVENFYKCQNFYQFGKIQNQLSQINILFYTSTANIQRRRPLDRKIVKAREVQGNHPCIYRSIDGTQWFTETAIRNIKAWGKK